MSRGTTIQVRVSHEEKARIIKNAEDFGLSPSNYLRSQALFTRPETPVRYETEQDRTNKAKVRKAVENEEPYEVKIELEAPVPSTTDSEEDERQDWIRKREIQLQGRMSSRAAQLQARQDWDKR